MTITETVTIINKSGKVVSTGKHLVNIFKDAKEAYHEKKAEIKAEHLARIKAKNNQKLMRARELARDDARSEASSHRSHRSHRSGRSTRTRDEEGGVSRPPLTYRNLTHISETASETSSRRSRSRSSYTRTRRPLSPSTASSYTADDRGYRQPYIEDAGRSQMTLVRRHTDLPTASEISTGSTLPPPYTSQIAPREPMTMALRTQSETDLSREVANRDIEESESDIDMNLAYGDAPPDLQIDGMDVDAEAKKELEETMTKLDTLLLEAECLQHSATTIMSNLQANPEAMAAVALTLAELSNLLAKMSPAILTALKTASPAIFGLLVSPQFLIATGVAIGVTIVMFGGYKIIKCIQGSTATPEAGARTMEAPMAANPAGPAPAPEMIEQDREQALTYDSLEMGSIDSWRRGIADIEAQSIATSADGELITPTAARHRKERIRERRAEERKPDDRRPKFERTRSIAGSSVATESVAGDSVISDSTVRSRHVRRIESASTILAREGPKPWDLPLRGSSRTAVPAPSESGRSHRHRRPSESGRTEKSRVAPSESGRSERSERSKAAPSESGRSHRSKPAPSESGRTHTFSVVAPSEAGTKVPKRSKTAPSEAGATDIFSVSEKKEKKPSALKKMFMKKDKKDKILDEKSEVGSTVSRRTVPLLIDI